jgi:proteic killer suppression protein
MEIRFRTRKLLKHYENHREAEKAYGAPVASKYVLRINIIKAAKSIDDLTGNSALRCHPLKGNRDGQWAMKLDKSFRLIFTLEGERLSVVCVEEVSKHYDD